MSGQSTIETHLFQNTYHICWKGQWRSQPPQWRWACTDGNKASFSGAQLVSKTQKWESLFRKTSDTLFWDPSGMFYSFSLICTGILTLCWFQIPKISRIFLASFANRRALKLPVAQCSRIHSHKSKSHIKLCSLKPRETWGEWLDHENEGRGLDTVLTGDHLGGSNHFLRNCLWYLWAGGITLT